MKSGSESIAEAIDIIYSDLGNYGLVIMPLTRLLFYEQFSIGIYNFFPEDIFDIDEFNPRENINLEQHLNEEKANLNGDALRGVLTSYTGFDVSVLRNNPLVVFPSKMDWGCFKMSNTHEDDLDLIKRLSSEAEKALDVIRFHYCRLELPDTLPGAIGSWTGSADYLGAMIYSPRDDESFLIGGSAVECSVVIKGLGLEVDNIYHKELLDPRTGEVAAIASHGLSLLSDAMASTNETVKFVRMMTLFEFLASPDEYKQWKKVKGEIVCHSAKSKSHYVELMERFRYFSSSIVDDVQVGLRTLIVHQGKLIQELINSREERNALFEEMHTYAFNTLSDMIEFQDLTWKEFSDKRISIKEKL